MKRALGCCNPDDWPEYWPNDLCADDAARTAEAGPKQVWIGEFARIRLESGPGRSASHTPMGRVTDFDDFELHAERDMATGGSSSLGSVGNGRLRDRAGGPDGALRERIVAALAAEALPERVRDAGAPR